MVVLIPSTTDVQMNCFFNPNKVSCMVIEPINKQFWADTCTTKTGSSLRLTDPLKSYISIPISIAL